MNMFTKNSAARKRGRPPGRSAHGDETRQRLYETAVALIGERGYDATTLRDIAGRADVSVGLMYRYFPSKRAVVMALYEQLSAAYADRAATMPAGPWHARFMFAMETSLDTLRPHRAALQTLTSIIVSAGEEGLFARGTAFSRLRVQAVFERAVLESRKAPPPDIGEPLARILYLLHLAVILWWLLDKSPRQRATQGLLALLRQILPAGALALRVPLIRRGLRTADELFTDALLTDG